MPEITKVIHERIEFSDDEEKQFIGSVVVGSVLASLTCLGAWVILRNPEFRAWITGLVPHRYPIAFAAERQLLAPRSIAIAGAILLICSAGVAFWKWRRFLPSKLNAKHCAVGYFTALQTGIAVAVVLNISFYFYRVFHRLPCQLREDTVLTHWVPQAYPHAKMFRELLPAGTRVALRAEGGTFNRYLFSALSYPIACYYADSISITDPFHDKQWLSLSSSRHVSVFVHYDPFSTTEPLVLKRCLQQ
jgi:hypothetical protein